MRTRHQSQPDGPTEVIGTPTQANNKTLDEGLVGKTLASRYLVERELKRGGFGIVYLARDTQIHSRPVVVKVLLEDSYESEYVVQKFRQEIEALSRIDHPGIVGLIDAGELANGKPFIVMQFVDGVTLRTIIKPEGMEVDRAANIIQQIGRALSAAHERGIFHRDLKPENIMLQSLGPGEEQVKIIDFGIAKVKDSVIAPSTALNLSPGTVAYMAPEQLSGRPITAATDIFALGAISYEMITGRKPFNPETAYQLLELQQSGVRAKPSDLRPSISPKAQEVVLKALAFNPGNRYTSARQFGDDLARALLEASVEPSGPQVKPPPPTQIVPPETSSSEPASEPTIQAMFQPAMIAPAVNEGRSSGKFGVLIALVVVLFLLIAAGVGAVWYFKRSSPAAPAATSLPERQFTYGLTVQKMRNGRPYQDAFAATGQEIFENGWKFRLNLKSPQSGFLYLINEGPGGNGKTTYNVLFPEPATNSGSSQVKADQQIETAWMVMDQNQGTEKFWMIWADKEVPELEAVKRYVNAKDRGTVKDEQQAEAIRDFLARESSAAPKIETDKSEKQTTLKKNGSTVVHLLEIEHR